MGLNLLKSFEFFNPYEVHDRIHIIGCGSVGSNIATLLARAGLENFDLYDMDTIEDHNLANQAFTEAHIGMSKVDATKQIMVEINSDLAQEGRIVIHPEGWNGERLNGYVFLAVDNIELRKKICEVNMRNTSIKAVFDFRTRLTDAQHYAADWSKVRDIKALIDTMDFTHEEAHALTKTTACGVELGVAATVVMVCCVGVANFINFVLGKPLKTYLGYISPFDADIW